MSLNSFKNVINKMWLQIILALNNLQWLIYHQNKPIYTQLHGINYSIPGHSGPESNANEGVTPLFLKLEPHH